MRLGIVQQKGPHALRRHRVQAFGWLVQKDQAGVVQQRPHHDHELLLTAGERGELLVELLRKTDASGDLLHALAGCAHGYAAQGVGEVKQVLAYREAKVG